MAVSIECVNPPRMSKPGGHYSHVVVHGSVAYLSGQLPIGADGRLEATASFERQATLVLDNVRTAVEGVGSSLSKVLRCTVYLSDIGDWPAFD